MCWQEQPQTIRTDSPDSASVLGPLQQWPQGQLSGAKWDPQPCMSPGRQRGGRFLCRVTLCSLLPVRLLQTGAWDPNSLPDFCRPFSSQHPL